MSKVIFSLVYDLGESVDSDVMEDIGENLILGRWGKASECAKAIAMLAGPDSAYITGQDLAVDGGILAKLSF